jgi:hypothetical protein
MRRKAHILLACGAVLTASGPACAGQLVIPDANSPTAYRAYTTRSVEQPWAPSPHIPVLVQTPVANLIAAQLGFAEGHAELFRYRVEDAPSAKTVFDGTIAGGGIRLRLSW